MFWGIGVGGDVGGCGEVRDAGKGRGSVGEGVRKCVGVWGK